SQNDKSNTTPMIYENNELLREYLNRGATGAYREFARHPRFELDASAFSDALVAVCEQHPHLNETESEARAAFRLLTSGAPPEIAAPLPSRWFRFCMFSRQAAVLAWPWLKIAWAVTVLILATLPLLLLAARPAHAAASPRRSPSRSRGGTAS